jgi:hypothetical protein
MLNLRAKTRSQVGQVNVFIFSGERVSEVVALNGVKSYGIGSIGQEKRRESLNRGWRLLEERRIRRFVAKMQREDHPGAVHPRWQKD